MEKIVNGILFEGQVLPDTWTFRVWESNGHREISARPKVEWREVGPGKLPMAWEDYVAAAHDAAERAIRQAMWDADIAEKKERSRRRSARRAKTTCRRVIKTAYFDEMLTVTYRENQQDVELFKKHFKEWVRRMKRALGDFEYCAGFEPQERGAWHAHVCCRKLPKVVGYEGVKVESYKLGTKIWRDVVGDTPDGKTNGLVYVGGKDAHGRPMRGRRTCAEMAAYVAKYITKHAHLFPDEKNRYSRSDGIVPGTPYEITVSGVATVFDALLLAFQAGEGERVVNHRAKEGEDMYWLVTEPLKPPKRGMAMSRPLEQLTASEALALSQVASMWA